MRAVRKAMNGFKLSDLTVAKKYKLFKPWIIAWFEEEEAENRKKGYKSIFER